MSANPSTLDIPSNPYARRHWVNYQLRLKGLTLTRLAAKEGVSKQAISTALVLPSAALERAIAKAIGVPVEKLFPERFDEAGERIPSTRDRQGSTRGGARNVQRRRSA